MWWPDSDVGQLLISFIVLLFVLSVIFGSKHFLRYKVERANLNHVIRRLKEERGDEKNSQTEKGSEQEDENETEEKTKVTEEIPSDQYIQPELVEISEIKKGLNSDTLIFERLEAIEKMRAHQVKVNLNTLQQMTLAREDARFGIAIPSFVTNMAMMLGILGTFWGLAMMVQDISLEMPNSAQLNIGSWKQALENISAVLDGMKTAFSTTLWGMSCAVISTGINFSLQRTQASFLQKMEKFTTEDLLPATVPVVEDETLLERVSLQLDNSFSRLNGIFEENNKTIEELNAVEEAFGGIITEIRGITKNEASRNLDQVIEKLGEANTSIVTLVEHLPNVVTAIQNTNHEIDNMVRSQRRSMLLNASPQAVLLFTAGVIIVLNLIIYFWF